MDSEGNQLRQITLQQFLISLKEQFECRQYDVNASVRVVNDAILVDEVYEATKDESSPSSKEVTQELIMIAFCLAKAPYYWVELLTQDEIETETLIVYLNFPITLTKVYRMFKEEINTLLKPTCHNFDFEKMYMNSKSFILLAELFNTVACEVASSFEEGKKVVVSEINEIESEIEKYKIMNAFLLFGILKQASEYAQRKIEDILGEYLFRNVPLDQTVKFCKYIVENYDSLTLKCRTHDGPEIMSEKEVRDYDEEQARLWINYLKNTGQEGNLRKVISEKGEMGIMIMESEQNHADNVILKVDDGTVRAINCKISQKSWKVEKPNMKDLKGLYKIIKGLKTKSAQELDKELIDYEIRTTSLISMGNNLGKCLANIDSYKDANDFIVDLSQRTIVTGSMNYIVSKIPIMNYLFVAGGLTFSFYVAFSNEATSKRTKMKQIGNASVTAASSIGSALAGMSIGQVLIPIPVVGAFVGGVIGGFLGEKGSKKISSILDKKNFLNLIEFLHKKMKEDKYWEFSKETLTKMGISKSFFNESNPRKVENDSTWLTTVCFCIVSFYESRRYAEFTRKQIEEREKAKLKDGQHEEKGNETAFENEFNLVEIIAYLSNHKLALLNYLGKIESLVSHILAQL